MGGMNSDQLKQRMEDLKREAERMAKEAQKNAGKKGAFD
jgi:hypothetical protein